MGVVNIRGADETEATVQRAREMVNAGASIVDVGAQSYGTTRPAVDEEEEQRRLLPVLERFAAEKLPAALSVDTYRSRIAREALALGAGLVNDCSGLADSDLAKTVAEFDAALVVTHRKGELNTWEPASYDYDDPIEEIVRFLDVRAQTALEAGVDRESILVDPGLEFGKRPETDVEILRRFGELGVLKFPRLLAGSRKASLESTTGLPPDQLLEPSLAIAALGWLGGARIFRVHDVPQTVRFLAMLDATAGGSPLSTRA
ncbi:MAG: dihydropteroate synthase [Polyangiaceae bacterium]